MPPHVQPALVPPPPPAHEVVKDDFVAPARGDDLPVAPAQGPLGPPPILDEPGLPDAIDVAGIDTHGAPVLPRADGDPAGDGEATRPAHPSLARVTIPYPSNGARTVRRSGKRDSGSTGRMRRAASRPAATRVWRIASCRRAVRAAAGSSSNPR